MRVLGTVRAATVRGQYLHWDNLRHREPPPGLSLKEWWFGLKVGRLGGRKVIPLHDKGQHPFHYCMIDPLPESLHRIDLGAGGTIQMPELVMTPETQKQFLVRSLIEEAFTSSQLEGAATTRERAKEMIRKDQKPRSLGERMVLNNYRTMEHILSLREERLTREVIFEIHRMVTDGTLDDPSGAGRLRRSDEVRIVGDAIDPEVVYHVPPDAGELDARMDRMCAFANGEGDEGFIHPAIRSMILHFWLAYDYPFIDGNGRTARALFYWSMLHRGYWLFEFVSISNIILKGPMKYQRAFLETETDDNDLTYFLIYHSQVIDRAIDELYAYIRRKVGEVRSVSAGLRGMTGLNHRQRALMVEVVRHPDRPTTVESHRRTFGVVTQTARNDLMDLMDRGLMRMEKAGRAFQFVPVADLEQRLRDGPPQA